VGTGENKNLPRVVDAVQDLPVVLVIIGKLSASNEAQLAARRVTYENHVNLDRGQLVEQYRRADALVFASTYEGFGLPIIEAQAVGRPVVTSNLCSMPEAAGNAAWLVDPFDVADIRRAILRLINEPEFCDELVEKGFENASRYSPERLAEQFAEVYEALARGQEEMK
jgi:glycosyltransferase involved in cell wall biosynthesis